MDDQKTKPRVGFFATCLVNLFRPSVGFSAVELLEAAGCQVDVPPDQSCCGQPLYNSGDSNRAAASARRLIAEFESYDYVVAPSGSCAAMISEHFPALFETDLPWLRRARRLASKTYELTRFLTEVCELDIPAVALERVCTYHDSCSGLREQGVKDQPRQLLQQVDGLVLKEMVEPEVCCGFGGTFCAKYPAISERMVSNKASDVERTGAEMLVGGDLGCLLNIAGFLRRRSVPTRVFHVAEVLAGRADGPGIGDPADSAATDRPL